MTGLQGSLKDFDITDILQLININKKDGCLEIIGANDFGRIYFENGAVTHAETSDRVGEHAVHKVLMLSDGTFKFLADEKSDRKTINLPIQHLMLEAARSIDEWKQIEKLIPSIDLIVKMVDNPETGTENIKLSSEEWKILTFVDNQSTIKEIAKKVNQSEFQSAKIFFGLISSGLVIAEEKEQLTDVLNALDEQINTAKDEKPEDKEDDKNKKSGIRKFFSR